ncbi:DUF3450 domain-containing protein [Halomonas urumqiensis]|uniref:DUF3450 domain-containing protein n=1 Tax=Halomonas urumqiensis TaxID=1684789 RepID=UPI0015E0B6B6|nr:DUF3450 domain-containing protein [Halomonas urumqiensis]GHE21908.1 DUF3450 domain-containing protein [Halomonas urumqiensis]
MDIRPRNLLCVAALWLVVAPQAFADSLLNEATDAQRAQAALQARIDQADAETRDMLAELRQLEAETQRLDARGDALAPRLEREGEKLARREVALDTLADTREALPRLERALVARLDAWVKQDVPFLREERLARAESLDASLEDLDMSSADRLDRILSAWRTELDYGREFDAWRGYLGEGDERREVDFLRLGRVGFYYLTPDARQGGVWRAEDQGWVALDDSARDEVRHGLSIAREQRAPELLTLPVSRQLERSASRQGDEMSASDTETNS